MAQTHYDVLGVKPAASASEIRSAYRKLVLLHHPDRSKDPRSGPVFLQVKDAYEALSDPVARQRYDDYLALLAKRAQEEARKRSEAARRIEEAARQKAERRATDSGATVAEEILRLQSLYGKGRHFEAEKLAYTILQIDPRQAVPYAVLADISRGRGEVNEASKMYAYAAQMDPNNPVYQRRYEALLKSSRIVTDRKSTRLEAEDNKILAPMVGGGFVLFAGIYVAFNSEAPVFGHIALVSSWSMGLLACLFLSGVAIGAALAVGNWLDRFEYMTSSSSGRAGPTMVLGMVAMVNFWVSAILYVLIALGLKAFNYSTTRLMLGVSAVTILLAVACIPSRVLPIQALLWGGNVVYIGGLIGWMATDSMRPG
ncbi:MAG: DnaJ domain-containing protein [Fimbriimonas sp.]|nr:DnaJ domain-containing protein [Fimbriimonas sp.]